MDDLQRIPNGNMIMRMLIGGIPTQPFSMAGLPPLGNPNKELGDALKQLSAAKHGRPRAIIEKEIMDRLQTDNLDPIDTAKPVAGRMGASAGATQQKQAPASFLDDWLRKKETNSFKTPSSPFNSNPSTQPSTPINNVQQPINQPQQQFATYPPANTQQAIINDITPVAQTPQNSGIQQLNINQDNTLDPTQETTIKIR